MRSRWIEIATVWSGHAMMFFQWGCPDGFYVHWQGRKEVFQPVEFRKWEEIIWALRRKLHLRGLDEIGIALDVERRCLGPGGLLGVGGKWEMKMRAHVIRRAGGKWKPNRDYYE